MDDFRQMLTNLLTSRKAIAAVVALIVAIAAKYGLNLDPELVRLVVGVIGVYILAQGIADSGKEGAKIAAAAQASPAMPEAKKAVKKVSKDVTEGK